MHPTIARFTQALQLKNVAPGTIYRYQRDLSLCLAHSGILDPNLLDEQHVRAFLLALVQQQRLSPSTVSNVLAALRSFFSLVLERPSALASIPWPRRPSKLPDIWSASELLKLFSAVSDVRFRTLLLTTYATGLRVSEVCRLQVQDIDRARGVIHVRLGKGGKDRLVPLPPRLLKHLEDYWRVVRPPQPYLFPGPRSGRPMPNKTIEAVINDAAFRSGVNKRATPHTLRHCFATHALENGMDLHTLQCILGHSSLRSTERYLHLSLKHISQALSPLFLLDLPTPLEARS